MFGDPPKQLPQHFAVIMVPEFTMMPVTSAIEPLRIANRLSEKTLYKWTMHSVDGQPVAASNNILAMVDGDLSAVPENATILVCAGLNVQRHTDKRLIAWLRKVARKGTDIGAVCTGAHILAEAGLLDGYKCTIHWENLPGLLRGLPGNRCDRRTVRDRPRPLHQCRRHHRARHDADADRQPARAGACLRRGGGHPAFAHPPPQRTPAHVAAGAHRRPAPEARRHHRGDGEEPGGAAVALASWPSRRAFRPASWNGCSAAIWTAAPSAIIWNSASRRRARCCCRPTCR